MVLCAVLCTTCDTALQARLFHSGTFWNYLAEIALPMVIGSVLLAWLTHRIVAHYDRKERRPRAAPVVTASVLSGIGLGAFLDGILLHQVLQWHQMVSNRIAPLTLEAKNINMFWDGMFHLVAWVFTAAGIVAFYRLLGRRELALSGSLFAGSALLGWGIFNFMDGIFNHFVFRYHNVREIVANPFAWNLGFLLFAIAQILLAWLVIGLSLRSFAGDVPAPTGVGGRLSLGRR